MTESPSETMTETGSELVWGTTAFVPGSDVGLVGRLYGRRRLVDRFYGRRRLVDCECLVD